MAQNMTWDTLRFIHTQGYSGSSSLREGFQGWPSQTDLFPDILQVQVNEKRILTQGHTESKLTAWCCNLFWKLTSLSCYKLQVLFPFIVIKCHMFFMNLKEKFSPHFCICSCDFFLKENYKTVFFTSWCSKFPCKYLAILQL